MRKEKEASTPTEAWTWGQNRQKALQACAETSLHSPYSFKLSPVTTTFGGDASARTVHADLRLLLQFSSLSWPHEPGRGCTALFVSIHATRAQPSSTNMDTQPRKVRKQDSQEAEDITRAIFHKAKPHSRMSQKQIKFQSFVPIA